MTNIYIVRHAEIRRSAGDPGITEEGKAQALRVAVFLKDKRVTRVYTSPLLRAQQTADVIAVSLGVPLGFDYRLRERINWGDVPGQTWETFAEEWNKGDADPEYTAPGGLSARTAAGRMFDFIQRTAPLFAGQSLVIVSHGGIIGDFVSQHFRHEDILRFQPAWLSLRSDIIHYASITTVQWSATGLALLGFAEDVS